MSEQTTERRNFLGIPVEGDINASNSRVRQRPLEEFAPLLTAVLDDEFVTAFGWRQYTPYFNDGDPCVFSANEPWFATVGTPQPGDDEFEWDDLTLRWSSHPTLGKQDYKWINGEMVDLPFKGNDEARYRRCQKLSTAIDSGEFDDVLLEAFGDNAEIVVRRTGITVETYEQG